MGRTPESFSSEGVENIRTKDLITAVAISWIETCIEISASTSQITDQTQGLRNDVRLVHRLNYSWVTDRCYPRTNYDVNSRHDPLQSRRNRVEINIFPLNID